MEIARPSSTSPTPLWFRRWRTGTTCRPSAVALPRRVRKEMEQRKRGAKILTYDDVLFRLRATRSSTPCVGPAARPPARALRCRPRRRVPGHRPGAVGHHAPRLRQGGATLVLIGDPKQAIYAFRGADVHAYLRRARPAVRMDARRQLAQRPGAARRIRRALRRCAARPSGHPLPPGQGRRRQPGAAAVGAPGRRPVACPGAARGGRPRPADRQAAAAQVARRPDLHRARPRRARWSSSCRRRRSHHAAATASKLGAPTLHPGDIAVLVRSNSQAMTVCDALLQPASPP